MIPPLALAIFAGGLLYAALKGETNNDAGDKLENGNCNAGCNKNDQQQPSNPQPVKLSAADELPKKEHAEAVPETTTAPSKEPSCSGGTGIDATGENQQQFEENGELNNEPKHQEHCQSNGDLLGDDLPQEQSTSN